MTGLLRALREAGAGDQVTALLARDPAAHADLGNPDAVAQLLDGLLEASAHEQAKVLIDRLPGESMFRIFCRQEGRQERFWFGREADGSPAGPWGWEVLD